MHKIWSTKLAALGILVSLGFAQRASAQGMLESGYSAVQLNNSSVDQLQKIRNAGFPIDVQGQVNLNDPEFAKFVDGIGQRYTELLKVKKVYARVMIVSPSDQGAIPFSIFESNDGDAHTALIAYDASPESAVRWLNTEGPVRTQVLDKVYSLQREQGLGRYDARGAKIGWISTQQENLSLRQTDTLIANVKSAVATLPNAKLPAHVTRLLLNADRLRIDLKYNYVHIPKDASAADIAKTLLEAEAILRLK